MLLRITDKCSMGCSHCMVNATPEGKHMTQSTFAEALDFMVRVGDSFCLLTGGEPTEHPNVLGFATQLKAAGLSVGLLTNGAFFSKDPRLAASLRKCVTVFQVTNDPRFYPETLEFPDWPEITVTTNIGGLAPFGRALENKLDCDRKYPMCFNLRSAARSLGGFKKAVQHIRSLGFFCTPAINPDGTISAGETPYCADIGHVTDSMSRIDYLVCNTHCSRCGLVNNLNDDQLKAIGCRRAVVAMEGCGLKQ